MCTVVQVGPTRSSEYSQNCSLRGIGLPTLGDEFFNHAQFAKPWKENREAWSLAYRTKSSNTV